MLKNKRAVRVDSTTSQYFLFITRNSIYLAKKRHKNLIVQYKQTFKSSHSPPLLNPLLKLTHTHAHKMDVDNTDIDLIACKFRTMNTNDKDHLINEFKRLSNTQLGTEGCCFYLDLAEWNLNSALWAYYEYETAAAANNLNNGVVSGQYGVIGSGGGGDGGVSVDQNEMYSAHGHGGLSNVNEMPEMQFVCDITIGEGESVAPNTNFLKTWRIKNTGRF